VRRPERTTVALTAQYISRDLERAHPMRMLHDVVVNQLHLNCTAHCQNIRWHGPLTDSIVITAPVMMLARSCWPISAEDMLPRGVACVKTGPRTGVSSSLNC
jgi:hypothetical protein